MKNIKECCWAIILSSEYIKKSQETRVKWGEELKYIENDVALWSQIFAISQIKGIEENGKLKRSFMIFFRSFAETFFLDIEAKRDTTAALCDGKLISISLKNSIHMNFHWFHSRLTCCYILLFSNHSQLQFWSNIPDCHHPTICKFSKTDFIVFEKYQWGRRWSHWKYCGQSRNHVHWNPWWS